MPPVFGVRAADGRLEAAGLSARFLDNLDLSFFIIFVTVK
jgi:hypothetical protein